MSKFKELQALIMENATGLQKAAEHIFEVNVDKEKIWEVYLNSFEGDEVQAHTCNCCKSFLRQWAGIVFIHPCGRVNTIWDVDIDKVDELYKKAITNINNYIRFLPIICEFKNNFPKLGTKSNSEHTGDGGMITWSHFYFELLPKFVQKSGSIAEFKGASKTKKEVLERSLQIIDIHTIDTVLDLIKQNSLYRGNEFSNMITQFKCVKINYKDTPEELKQNFLWRMSAKLPPALCSIKNSSIGTLLVNLAEGMELDTAVTKYESVVAPANYKRPTALVTPAMISKAEKTITELGYLSALDRRHCNISELPISEILYTDKSNVATKSVFDTMKEEAVVNAQKLTKVEEVTIEKFLADIVPNAKTIEVLFESKYAKNLMSLITATDSTARSLFKWDNPYSWSYNGNITDSIKERVKTAGGSVTGNLRISLSWDNRDDLDLHLKTGSEHIFFSNKHGKYCSLDVDANARVVTPNPVENIIFPDVVPEGTYYIDINNYNRRTAENQGYTVQVEYMGNVHNYYQDKNTDKRIVFTLAAGAIEFDTNMDCATQSKEEWGINTNTFVKVQNLLLSPNHWNKPIGNKHYFFIFQGCKNPDEVRGFYNEFLNDELSKERKAFELLGSKLKVPYSDTQLSGLGFSDTQRNSVIVRVTGSFSRTLKVTF